MNKRSIALLLLIGLLAGCASKGQVSHVVIYWLKTPGDEAARQQIIDKSQEFTKIPGVVAVRAGRAMPSTRPVVDTTFDVAIVMTFKDEASLRAYDQNPIHKKAVSEVRPLTAKLLIYDVQHDAKSAGKSLMPR